MSKNTRNTAFRKVDVDQYEEEKYEEEIVADDGVTGPNDAEVQGMISKGNLANALQYVLANPPVASKNQTVKDKAVQTVMKVLTGFKSTDIDTAIKNLDQDKQDILMKYIYRGFDLSTPDGNGYGAQLLVWHDKLFAIGGLGSIIRVLADRRRV